MSVSERKTTRRRIAGAYISSLISIALVLMLVGVASLLVINARRASDFFREQMQVSVIMRPEVSDAAAAQWLSATDSLPFVKSAVLVTREQGTEELKAMLGDDFLSVFSSSPVPVSVDFTLNAGYVSRDSIEVVKKILSASPLVEEIESRDSIVEALNSNLSRISVVLGAFIIVLLFISVVLIGNTVRLSVYARRFTIHTMRLVGATLPFIRKPFIWRGALQGFLASLLAISALGAALLALHDSFPMLFSVLEPGMLALTALVVVVSGVLICAVSTFFVVNSIVTMSKDDLYY